VKRSVKLVGAAAVIAATALIVSACAPPTQNESGEAAVESLVIDKSFDLVTADPARMFETTGGIVLHAVYDSLLTFADGDAEEPLPSVASDWSVNDDATEYTFTIRDGDATQADVFAAIAGHGVRFELVHGGINDIGGRVFGHLTLAVSGDAGAVDRAIAAARAHAPLIEEDARG